MQFQFITLDETKSQTKVRGNIYLFDFWFILIYFAVSGDVYKRQGKHHMRKQNFQQP